MATHSWNDDVKDNPTTGLGGGFQQTWHIVHS